VLALGLMIDERYRVERLLGRGGMADVYRAVDTEGGRPVALKLLRHVQAEHLRRFRIEAAALARLDHPGVVKLYRTGAHDGVPYLALELVDGPTLADELVAGPLGTDRSLDLARDLADAIAHAHRVPVVHRDVKPGNVLVDVAGQARLSDFGIARVVDAGAVTATGMVVGTGAYLAPEQLEGRVVGPPADVYALGLVVLECLTGTRCYPGGQLEAAMARLCRPAAIPPGLPGWLRDVLAAMTDRDPARRPTARAAAEAFDTGSAPLVLEATARIVPGTTDTAVLAPTARITPDSTTRMPIPARPAGGHRPVAARRSRLVALVAASVALTVPAWLFGGSKPQSADAPPGPGRAPAAANPTSTTASTTPQSPTADEPSNVDVQADGHGNQGDSNRGDSDRGNGDRGHGDQGDDGDDRGPGRNGAGKG
jgi:eukaryotic-like serine/threonine-protein kinase